MKIYEVGGCVRDDLLGTPSKDVDFVMLANSFAEMRQYLVDAGFKIFIEKPEMVTIRCSIPPHHPLRSRTKDADFVLARKDSLTGDGRRPDYVEPGTLADDLARRDFTVNALARDPETLEIIDHHNGLLDLEKRVLRFVGDPVQRIKEDGLRVLRGFRFALTKNFEPEKQTWDALCSPVAVEMLHKVHTDRIADEIDKMFRFDSIKALRTFGALSPGLLKAIFREPLHLTACLKQRKS